MSSNDKKMQGLYDFIAGASVGSFCLLLIIVMCGVSIGNAIKECPK
jgi:hypothetical protein